MSSIVAHIAQTFTVNQKAVKNSKYFFIKSIDLYLGTKPSALRQPGLVMYLCETKLNNNLPIPDLEKQIKYGKSRVEYSNITTSTTGTAATTFDFTVPVLLKTDTTYAIVVKLDFNDINFTFWRNKVGEAIGSTVSTAVNSGALDGRFFTITNGTNLTPQNDIDLKFKISAQKFKTDAPYKYNALNRSFEFIKTDGFSSTGEFIGGEYVFTNIPAPAGQTVSVSAQSKIITGTNTKFQTNFVSGNLLVLKSGNVYSVSSVNNVVSNTSLVLKDFPPFNNSSAQYIITPVARVWEDRKFANGITLVASTSNSTYNFLANSTSNTIIGEASGATAKHVATNNFKISKYEPEFGIITLPFTDANVGMRVGNSSYLTSNTTKTIVNNVEEIFLERGIVFSTTNETLYGTTLENNKSVNFDVTFSSQNEYVSPVLDEEDMHFNVSEVTINDNLTGEHKRYGNAVAKYISKPITLTTGQAAEDIVVYVTAYRPAGTDVKVYVRFYNEQDIENFEDKDWTELRCVTSPSVLSSTTDINSLVELQYTLETFPVESFETGSAGLLIDGFFATTNGSAVMVSTNGAVNNFISNSDLIKITNPLFPDTTIVTLVTDANSSSVTVDNVFNDIDGTLLYQFISDGLRVERVTNKNVAFKNQNNFGILRYHNNSMSSFDSYNRFALKIVLVANSSVSYFPFVDDIRGIAVSV